jgi:tetratricopeptide (TPR) repeat protein
MSLFKKMFGSKATTGNAAAVDLATALSMHLRGELDQALAAYTAIKKESPDDNLARFFAAAIMGGNGEVADAADALRALSRDISAQGDSISRALILEIIALATNEMIPGVADIMVSFAEELKTKRFVQEAVVCLEIAAGLVPENADVLYKFGDTLHDLRIYDYAESVLQGALKRSPNHWGALYTYAVLLQDLKRDEEALAYYEKAVDLDPDHPRCRNNYGAALLRTNRLEEALVHCSAAAELDPGSPFVKVNLGNIHLLMEQYETARSCFAEAILLNEHLAPAYFGLGRVEELLGSDPARVRDLYIRTLQLDPSLANMHPALKNLLTAGAPVEREVN